MLSLVKNIFLKRIYNLLLRDICTAYILLPRNLRLMIWGIFLLMLGQAAMELITILSIAGIGKIMSNPQTASATFPYQILFSIFPQLSGWIQTSQRNFIFFAAIILMFIVAGKNLVTYFACRETNNVGERISAFIGFELMQRFLYSDYRWHISTASNKALQIMMWRNNLANMLVAQLAALTGFITCSILFVGLLIQAPVMSFSVVSVASISAILIYAVLKKKVDAAGKLSAEAIREETRSLNAAIRGVREVLIYNQQVSFLKTHSESIYLGIKPKNFIMVANSIPSLALEIVGFALVPVAIALLIFLYDAQPAEIVPAVMLLLLTAWRVLPYLNRGVSQLVIIRGLRPMALPVLDFLFELHRNSMQTPPEPNPNFTFSHTMRLENASFSYPDTDTESLTNINITVRKGEQVGLIGASGAGKSTICNILSGLMPPTRGRLLVDEREMTPNDLAAFRQMVGFVPQNPYLMGGTLADNVAFSEWGKPWDEARVRKACELASIDFINTSPKGILLPIGEHGIGLSGGQAQRVAIARALYANPAVIIFDEATSALDAGNETAIIEAIESLRGHVTCIVIAHRLTSVERCDTLFWLDGGRLVAQGPPSEILPQYKEFFRKIEGQPSERIAS